MYLSFYKLKNKPFQISTDPRFLWLGEKHKEALATLRYGVLDNKGFLLLTGDVGTGKTTLINSLLQTLGKETLVASVRDPDLEPMDFFRYISHAFGIKQEITSKGFFLIQFERFLLQAENHGKKVLLIIDESQRINQRLLEEVRLLSNIEREESKLLNIFFVGQIEFNDIILRPENRAIRQRITINYDIEPLTEQETDLYIQHRLKVAALDERELSEIKKSQLQGMENSLADMADLAERDETFTLGAINEIYKFSRGYPRLINIICDRSLLTGFVEESASVTRSHVRECAKELTIPQQPQIARPQPVQQPIAQPQPVRQPTDQAHPAQPHTAAGVSDAAPNEYAEAVKRLQLQPHEAKEKSSRSKIAQFIIVAGLLLMLPLFYFGATTIEIQPLHGYTLMEFAQNLIQRHLIPAKQPAPGPDDSAHKAEDAVNPPKRLPATTDKSENQSQPSPAAVKKVGSGPIYPSTKEDDIEPKKEPRKETPADTVLPKTPPGQKAPADQERDLEPVGLNSAKADEGLAETVSSAENIPELLKIKSNMEVQVQPLLTFEKIIIPFPTNSNFPPEDSLQDLNMLVEMIKQQPEYKVFVTGYTDSWGSETFNLRLSEFRATSIKIYLVGKGLKASNIISRGLGSQNPLSPNDTDAGREMNRRVEIEYDL